MREIEDNLEISRLLLQYFKGELSAVDQAKVEKLLKEDSSLHSLFISIQRKEYLEDRIKRHRSVDLEQQWLVQKRKIKKEKYRILFFNYSRYAAAILILALIVVYSLFNYQKPFNDTKSEFIAKILPDSSKIQLVVGEGRVYEFEGNEEVKIQDSLMKVDIKGGVLVYSKPKNIQALQLKEEIHTLKIPRGGEYVLNLSDGSKIWVYSQTEIKYPKQFFGKKRVVQLINGEAYFEVAQDLDHPFMVETKKGLVEVLGTSFNIRSYNDEIYNTTTLVEGSVSLRHKYDTESTVKLSPGQQGTIIDVNRKIKVENIDIQPIIAWKNGFYKFNSNSIESIFNQLSRYYDFEVEYESDFVREMKFRGNIERKAGVIQILDLLEKTKKIKFEYEGKSIRVKEI